VALIELLLLRDPYAVPLDAPLLLIDVDGVISLFGFDAGSPPPGRLALIDGTPHCLSERAGPVLRRLSEVFEPVWCTGWEERADDHLPHLLDLPRPWPHVPLNRPADTSGTSIAGHWKLAPIDAYAGPDRPLAWIDDFLDDACVAWANARPGPTLLVPVEPGVGLTEDHEAVLMRWVDGTS
jgi:hypothetical protein